MRVMSDELSPIPTHIRVGPYRYTVNPNPDSLSDDLAAQVQYAPLKMQVSAYGAHDRKVEGLLHEVFHAVWELGLGVQDLEKKYKNEEVISRLTPHLLAVLRDNPDLVAYLTDCRDLT